MKARLAHPENTTHPPDAHAENQRLIAAAKALSRRLQRESHGEVAAAITEALCRVRLTARPPIHPEHAI